MFDSDMIFETFGKGSRMLGANFPPEERDWEIDDSVVLCCLEFSQICIYICLVEYAMVNHPTFRDLESGRLPNTNMFFLGRHKMGARTVKILFHILARIPRVMGDFWVNWSLFVSSIWRCFDMLFPRSFSLRFGRRGSWSRGKSQRGER